MMRRKSWLVIAGVAIMLAGQFSWPTATLGDSQGAKTLFKNPETGTMVAPQQSNSGTINQPHSKPPVVRAPAETKLSPEPWMGLAYWAVWERPGMASVRVADPSHVTFRSGDRVRFYVKTNTEGFLYVINRGPSGQEALLFPHAGMPDMQNRVEAHKEYALPYNGWFRFDDQPGEEKILILLSPTPLTNVLDASPQRPQLSPETSAHLMAAVNSRGAGAKDLMVETDDTPGEQTTYAGASFRPAAGAANLEVGPLVIYRTKLQHQ